MKSAINFEGKRFGNLSVVSRAPNKNGRVRWNCVCKCGKKSIVWANNLRTKASRSCGCFRTRLGIENPTWKGCGEIGMQQFNQIKSGATKRKWNFSISIEEIWDLFLKQNKKCALSGVVLSLERRRGRMIGTASLDRINNRRGYVSGNVQWVHKDVNFMKQDFSQSEFLTYCRLISQNNPQL